MNKINISDLPGYTNIDPPFLHGKVSFSGAYLITDNVTGKAYVGHTSNLYRRKIQHESDLRNNKHHSDELQDQFNNGHEITFEYVLMGITSEENIKKSIEIEQKILDEHLVNGMLFNKEPNASSSIGINRSDETKEKISKSKIGIKQTEETKKRKCQFMETLHEAQKKLIKIDDKIYNGINSASRETLIPRTSIKNRLENKNFPNYQYVKE